MAAKKKTRKPAAKRKTAKKAVKRKPAKKVVKRKTAKKAVKRKPAKKVVKRKVAKRAPAKKAVKRSTSAVKKAYTKSQIAAEIAEGVGITKKQVSEVFAEMANLVERHVKKGGAGSFNLPGLLKINTVRKKATKARKGINPFTKEPCVFKAKPARTVVKVRALKGLKDMV